WRFRAAVRARRVSRGGDDGRHGKLSWLRGRLYSRERAGEGAAPRPPRGGRLFVFAAAGVVVVEDRADAVPVVEQRVAARVAEDDGEGFVRLHLMVADHIDRD